MSSIAAQKKRLCDLISDFSEAVLVRCGAGDGDVAIPVRLIDMTAPGTLVLQDRDGTSRSEEFDDGDVLVTFQGERCTVWLKGKSRIGRDREELQHLLGDAADEILSECREDPTCSVIVVTGIEGEYWDRKPSHGLEQVLESAKALLMGSNATPAPPHGRVKLGSCSRAPAHAKRPGGNMCDRHAAQGFDRPRGNNEASRVF